MNSELVTALGSLAITGAVVSVVAQLTKRFVDSFATNELKRTLWVVLLSAAGGGLLVLLQYVPAPWWATFLGVAGAANTCYLWVVKWTNKKRS